MDHALGLVADLPRRGTRCLDLGSGGGVPGLVLASAWTTSQWILLEGGTSRADWLVHAVDRLSLLDRVQVVAQRAEEAGRGPLRAAADFVIARGFGPPAATAECGAPLLAVGGILLVAEPPGAPDDRWPPGSVQALGLEAMGVRTAPPAARWFLLRASTPDRFPRRVGIPARRLLF